MIEIQTEAYIEDYQKRQEYRMNKITLAFKLGGGKILKIKRFSTQHFS